MNTTLYRGSTRPGLVLLIGSAALLFSAPVLADVEKGVDAWSRGEFAAAVRQWQGPAAKGDPDAQFNLAQAYKLGRGVTQDLAKAERLFAQAAAQGHLQAADNLGLLLFQRGERAGALPYIEAASSRGDPRAHYVLGLAHFNGDGVAKDWERAYALVSLAQQAGLPQAATALSQMDEYIPLETRQSSVTLASTIAATSEQARRAQVAAIDLEADAKLPRRSSLRPFETPPLPEPGAHGADYTPGRAPPIAGIINSTAPVTGAPVSEPVAAKPQIAPAKPKAAPLQAASPAAARPAATSGPWRVQLGAFGVAGNADRLWNQVKSRPELAGRTKLAIPAGRVTKLQAGGFPSQESAQAACNRLKAGGFECLPVRD